MMARKKDTLRAAQKRCQRLTKMNKAFRDQRAEMCENLKRPWSNAYIDVQPDTKAGGVVVTRDCEEPVVVDLARVIDLAKQLELVVEIRLVPK